MFKNESARMSHDAKQVQEAIIGNIQHDKAKGAGEDC